MEYAQMYGYTKEQILYIGDNMGNGGGDSHIRLGGIKGSPKTHFLTILPPSKLCV